MEVEASYRSSHPIHFLLLERQAFRQMAAAG
jgi:hypothetical protein